MIILTIRTDKPESEVGVYDGEKQLAYTTWQAHRELAETLHKTIIDTMMKADVRLHQLEGIVGFKGPGSFTGLRIGLSVANALAYSLAIPVVATDGDDWLMQGVAQLQTGKNQKVAMPEYGAAPNITKPKH